jgi:hypothetical protein
VLLVVEFDPGFAKKLIYFEFPAFRDGLRVVAVEGANVLQETHRVTEASVIAVALGAYEIVAFGKDLALFVVATDVAAATLTTLMALPAMRADAAAAALVTQLATLVVRADAAAAALVASAANPTV